MKVLITGAKGQLGIELTKKLSTDSQVTVIPTDIDELDITDFQALNNYIQKIKPDTVINCAAHTKVDQCEDEYQLAKAINATGAGNLAKATLSIGASIIQVSTDYVFDGTGDVPYTEKDIPNPNTVYGKTKLEGEQLVKNINPMHYIVRTAWLYGEGANFLKTMLCLANERKSIKVVDDQTGSPTSTTQLADVIILLMNSGKYGTYHATCEGSCTWYDFAKEIFKISGSKIDLQSCTSDEFKQKAKRPEYSVLDNKNLRVRFGYKMDDWVKALNDYLRS